MEQIASRQMIWTSSRSIRTYPFFLFDLYREQIEQMIRRHWGGLSETFATTRRAGLALENTSLGLLPDQILEPTMTKPRTPRRQRPAASPMGTVLAPVGNTKGLSPAERAEYLRLLDEYALRLKPTDGPDLAELARVRCRARAVAERLDREGATVRSASGAVKRSPLLAALDALRAEDRRLVVRMGLQRPDASLARQAEVARGRERVALSIHRTYSGKGGSLLAGYREWAAAFAVSEQAALELCLEIAKLSRQTM